MRIRKNKNRNENKVITTEANQNLFYYFTIVILLGLTAVLISVLYELICANAIKKYELEQNRTLSQIKVEKLNTEQKFATTLRDLMTKEEENMHLVADNSTLTQRLLNYEKLQALKNLHGRNIIVLHKHNNVAQDSVKVATQHIVKKTNKTLLVLKPTLEQPAILPAVTPEEKVAQSTPQIAQNNNIPTITKAEEYKEVKESTSWLITLLTKKKRTPTQDP